MAEINALAGSSGNPEVDVFMSKLEHPLKKEIEEVRALILQSGVPLAEGIKWNAPNYSHLGEDRLTFNLRGKGGGFRLIFHCGAKARAGARKGRLIEDGTGMLEWASDDRAILTFHDADDAEDKKRMLAAWIRKWIEAAK